MAKAFSTAFDIKHFKDSVANEESNKLLTDIEHKSKLTADMLTDMIYRGNILIEQFNVNKQSSAEMITKQFSDLIATLEKRKWELISQVEESSLSSTTAIQLDIEQCQSYLGGIKSQRDIIDNIKSNKFGELTDETLQKILEPMHDGLSCIQMKASRLFRTSHIHVDLAYKPIDHMIGEYGKVSQLSIRDCECKIMFNTNHYEIELTSKTTNGEIYPYGGLSATACIGDTISCYTKDCEDGNYLIKIVYDPKFNDLPVIVKLDNQIVTELTELYRMVDQINIIDSFPTGIRIIDGGDKLYIRRECDVSLLHIDRNELYFTYAKRYSEICEKNVISSISFHHDCMVMITTCNYITCFYLYTYHGELLKTYTPELSPVVCSIHKAIFMQVDSIKCIIFTNEFSEECKIGVLNCEDGKIMTKIANCTIGLSCIKITLGDKFIYVHGKDKSLKHVIKIFDIYGQFISSLHFHLINSLSSKDNIVIIATDNLIIIYDDVLNNLKCTIPIQYLYDIIRYDKDKVYAISNTKKILSTWNIPKCTAKSINI